MCFEFHQTHPFDVAGFDHIYVEIFGFFVWEGFF